MPLLGILFRNVLLPLPPPPFPLLLQNLSLK